MVMTMPRDDFAIFILTHGRPDRQITYHALERCGYTGKVFLIIDDQDDSADQYFNLYGDQVIQFSKEAMMSLVDTADPEDQTGTVLFARKAVNQIAKDMGLKFMLVLDDDYTGFSYRYVKKNLIYSRVTRSFDDVVQAYLDLLEDTGALTVAMSQGGDHIGGIDGQLSKGLIRKAMNAFFFKVDNTVDFIGSMNDDVNTYVVWGSRGELFLTTMRFQLTQTKTQSQPGGLTELYLTNGTYTKSFYTVMMHPSSVMVKEMGDRVSRFHHHITWENTIPKIISSTHKKVA
jgi:hypothetical protein